MTLENYFFENDNNFYKQSDTAEYTYFFIKINVGYSVNIWYIWIKTPRIKLKHALNNNRNFISVDNIHCKQFSTYEYDENEEYVIRI